jgi:hypothetical protein
VDQVVGDYFVLIRARLPHLVAELLVVGFQKPLPLFFAQPDEKP